MKAEQGQRLTSEPTGSSAGAPVRGWVVAATLFGLMLVEGLREGGFWRADAFVVAVAAAGFLLVAVVVTPPDLRGSMVIVSILLLTLWWFVRAGITGSLAQFLPLGASFLAFAAAFAVVRPLSGRAREAAGLGVTCLGAAGALTGFAGLTWRWYPMAMPAQGLWRLSSTLTYSDAAGLVLGMCLLIALGTDMYPGLVRMVVCLCAGGLLATQSRGTFVAFACACALSSMAPVRPASCPAPRRRGAWRGGDRLVTGCGARAVARRRYWSSRWAPPASLVGTSALPPSAPQQRVVVALVLLSALVGALLLVHHEIGLRAFAPSDQDRAVEWSSALHQWGTAPIVGVGPDRLLEFRRVGRYLRTLCAQRGPPDCRRCRCCRRRVTDICGGFCHSGCTTVRRAIFLRHIGVGVLGGRRGLRLRLASHLRRFPWGMVRWSGDQEGAGK